MDNDNYGDPSIFLVVFLAIAVFAVLTFVVGGICNFIVRRRQK